MTEPERTQQYIHKHLLIVSLITIFSSIILSFQSNIQVFDEAFHHQDIARYYGQALTVANLQQHVCANGVVSHIIPGLLQKIIPVHALYLARMYNIACLAACIILVFLYKNKYPLLAFGLIATLCNPYALMCSSCFMTEFPSLLLVLLGFILILEKKFVALGHVLVGMAIISRLYYLALIPALFVAQMATIPFKMEAIMSKKQEIFKIGLYLLLSLAPVAALYVVWGGLTPPKLMDMSQQYSGIGLNKNRFIVATIYLGLYLAPFVLLINKPIKSLLPNWKILGIIMAMALLIIHFVPHIFNLTQREFSTGGVFALYSFFLNQNLYLAKAFAAAVVFLSFGNLYILYQNKPRHQGFIPQLAMAFVFFFIFQQMFVQGDIGFYERYTLTAAFFYGMLFVPGQVSALHFQRFMVLNYLLLALTFIKAFAMHHSFMQQAG